MATFWQRLLVTSLDKLLSAICLRLSIICHGCQTKTERTTQERHPWKGNVPWGLSHRQWHAIPATLEVLKRRWMFPD